ncbi:MAG TPA: tautomerase family protein [Vicinamibacteria bacterium]|jgi:4-oxalocrotonate tautomerase|nr:tautomerase family protein [Vicinamibacteria bacterium]
MPLVRISLSPGRSPDDRRAIADGVHRALVETAGVPPADRFQVVEEVPGPDLHFSPDFLGIARTPAVVFVQVFFSVGRSLETKKALYAKMAANLAASPGLRTEDLVINLVEVAKENWSFGNGLMAYPP